MRVQSDGRAEGKKETIGKGGKVHTYKKLDADISPHFDLMQRTVALAQELFHSVDLEIQSTIAASRKQQGHHPRKLCPSCILADTTGKASSFSEIENNETQYLRPLQDCYGKGGVETAHPYG